MYEFNLETCKLHISKGNSKLGEGVFNISLLPSDTPLSKKDGTKLTNIAGTCGGCCDNCKHSVGCKDKEAGNKEQEYICH